MMHSESELDASRAPFLEHLAELRIRLWWAVVAIFLSACGCFIFADVLGSVIMEPIITALKAHGQSPTLASRTVQGGFLFSFKVAIIFGVFLSIPVVLFQVWQFIAPGLKHGVVSLFHSSCRPCVLQAVASSPLPRSASCLRLFDRLLRRDGAE